MATSYEDAIRCPKCDQPGEVRVKRPLPNVRGASVHTVYCQNPVCIWYDTAWVIQINADGTIPEPKNHTGSNKMYVGFEGHEKQAQAIIQSMLRSDGQEDPHGPKLR